jgi:iron complex outermembrane receptor protein
VYFDRSERDDPLLFHDRMDIVDFEFQHGIAAGKQDILWGGGYRRARDRVLPGLLSTFIPAHKTLHWENLFVQDEIRLRETLRLTLGIKLDRNVYTGTEVLPSLRLAWKPDARQLLWGELSRAVRAPSRIDREFFLPGAPPFLIQGGPRFVSEVADVVELGYRAQPVEAFSYSLTLFHHRYDRLRSGQPQAGGYFQVENGTAGTVTGIEAWANLRASERWRLSGGLSTLNQSFRTKPGSNDPDGPVDLGNDPRYQWNLRSTFAWTPSLEFNLLVRGVGELPDPRIPAYTAVDANLRWQPDPHIEIGLFLQNVTGSGHIEFAPGPLAVASEYDRSAYLELLWRW